MDDLIRVNTHQLNNGRRLNRLNAYRLKDAKRRRDAAIAAAHEQYARDVETLTGVNDRLATLALRRGEAANNDFGERAPADELFDPQPHAMTRSLMAQAYGTVRALTRRMCWPMPRAWVPPARGIQQTREQLTASPDLPRSADLADAFACFAVGLQHQSPPCAGHTKPGIRFTPPPLDDDDLRKLRIPRG